MNPVPHIPERLKETAKACGYFIEYRRTTKYRGWPRTSTKPFGLYLTNGAHLASFATLEALERNFRARAGC